MLRSRLVADLARVRGMVPAGGPETGSLRRALQLTRGMAVVATLDLNNEVIRRADADVPPVGAATFDWVPELEAASSAVREEFQRWLESRPVPETTALMAARVVQPGSNGSVPDGGGRWRTLLLSSFGRPVRGIAEHFPATMAAVTRTPVTGNVGISVVEPRSRIAAHRDPNRGLLRLHLGVRVPTDRDACWIEVAGQRLAWEEGRCLVFDQGEVHEVRNDTDEERVVLIADVTRPLPPAPAVLNRIAQRAYERLPSYDGMVRRAELSMSGSSDGVVGSRELG